LDNEEQFGRPRLIRKPHLTNQEEFTPPVQETKPAVEQPVEQATPQDQIGVQKSRSEQIPPVRPVPEVSVSQTRESEQQQQRNKGREREDRKSSRPRDSQKQDFRQRQSDRQNRSEKRDRSPRADRPTHLEKAGQITRPLRNEPIKLSVVIPAYNEEGNIGPLLEQFKALFASVPYRCELIMVDDGSTDKTGSLIKAALPQYNWLKLYSHRRNFGLTAALETGISKASGKIICFYPADLQYHANEIPKFVAKIDSGVDIVTGWKQGHYGLKSIGSFIYNLLSRILFRVKVHDLNSVKAFTREVVDSFIYRSGWHRYMVVMAAVEGFKIDEVKVKLFPRRSGKSKFSFWWRLPAGFLDLLSVKFQLSFTKKPLLFFGSAGLISGFLGLLVGLVAVYLRFIKHSGFRPLLYLVILLIVSGLMLFFGGFLAELIVSVKDDVKRRKSVNLL